MLLAIDIGNTSIHSGVFKGRILRKTFRIPVASGDLKAQYIKGLGPYLRDIKAVVIVSVAPKVLRRLEPMLKKIVNVKTFVVGRDLDSGVKNLYRRPHQVGQDRLVNARAAYELHGGASVIVDFGTAITIDVVNKNKEYIGGLIVPGIEISLEALSERAVLLPKVRLKKPKSFLGKETKESMVSGAVYGFSGLCDRIVKGLKKRYCKSGKVVATGGISKFIGPYCDSVDKIDPELTLKGLRLIGARVDV